MITKLTLQNWKSFGEATVFFDPLTVLIGANDSGKSNLLEALWFLSQLPRARSLESIVSDHSERDWFRGSAADVIRRGQAIVGLCVELDESIGGTVRRIRYSLFLSHNNNRLLVSDEQLIVSNIETGEVLNRVIDAKTKEQSNAQIDVQTWETTTERSYSYVLNATNTALAQLAYTSSS